MGTEEEDVVGRLALVVAEQRAMLVSLARREGLGAEDAFDCVHDAFCTFLRMAVRGAVPDDPTEHAPLVAGIVRNAARNMRRRHRLARPHVGIDVMPSLSDSPTTEALVAHAEDCVRLRVCVSRLCKTRTVVMMRLLEERPGEDVAATLGLTRGYVDVLLHRAKTSLLVCMTNDDDEPTPA